MRMSRTEALRDFDLQEARPQEAPPSGRWSQAASALLAGTLMSLGLRRRSLGGTVVALASGALLYKGIQSRRHTPSLPARAKGHAPPSDEASRAHATEVERTLTVGRPAEELYRLWREPDTLGRIMGHFADVKSMSADDWHWKFHGPLGRELEWDSRVVEDRAPEFLRWEAAASSTLESQGWVRFRPAPGNWGTEVTLHLSFSPPGGALAEAVMKRLRGIPALQTLKALRRFKSLAETGEIPTLHHNPTARASADWRRTSPCEPCAGME